MACEQDGDASFTHRGLREPVATLSAGVITTVGAVVCSVTTKRMNFRVAFVALTIGVGQVWGGAGPFETDGM